MAKKFLGSKNLQLRGKPGDGASTEAKLAHAEAKAAAFNSVADQARVLGLERHAQNSENNASKLTGKMSHLRAQRGREQKTSTGKVAGPIDLERSTTQVEPEHFQEPFVRILLPGIGEKVNVVA